MNTENTNKSDKIGQVVTVWKVPKATKIDVGDFHDIGIFPSGELMAMCRTEGEADALIERLENNSPSERFGETMEDAPYTFLKSKEELWTQE